MEVTDLDDRVDDKNAWDLRQTGVSYMVDGMIDLLNTSTSDPSTHTYDLTDMDGNLLSDVMSEWGSFMVKDNCEVSVSCSQFSDHHFYNISLSTFKSNDNNISNIVGSIHTHPNAGRKFRAPSLGLQYNNTTGRSPADRKFNNYRTNGFFEVIINPNNIYMHNGDTNFSAPLNYFR